MQASEISCKTSPSEMLTDGMLMQSLKQAIAQKLAPQVSQIDLQGVYPEEFLRHIGGLGAYAQCVAQKYGGTGSGVLPALKAIEMVSATCLSTGFMTWCHNACAWYLQNSDNPFLKEQILPQVARGEFLSGTGLSNPMKHFAGIEKIKIIATPCKGGYILNGTLPWVSNIGDQHLFGISAQIEGTDDYLMAIAQGGMQGLELKQDVHFIALEGTNTFRCLFRNAFISHDWILASPCDHYVEYIKPGFILMQVGMGLGLAQNCIELMRRIDKSKAHVNQFLDDRPEELESELETLRLKSYRLAEAIGHGQQLVSKEILREVVEARATASELSLRASQSLMLHAGAIAYVHGSVYERRLRESYFVAMVTPALKHLRKVLASM
ncbi:MAG: acyl-CoA dehydrogenase family protein [Pseudanabaena sp.]|jgi:alkylation response protein AidB-like acyl-CoA dehydrogenase|nr:acyl-CoA/acyl-ACP dehydrogenase [Pseudanabaena sp. M53BS1SP1A06MG]MCA6583326.1 acyl-CoA/acyl-ACP dehydrogenase [Pseudanabaena sp. M34BS1SP1A06MG]MCA6585846.1 acyl-CoA/acyl-ACP dehydrogenase [Pseudanabaena sp. M051S1SP1A06QC]MCA6587728.1 acyl-CoA/acyl-ACP dehydrogenase [Pseudanabaena sp. M109S1SP1A06QC]MCA6593792.1 acyl-CoA/acyl-ACP dehydrogenase [Pseudanabaena sp. M38BS1SP1A06MG]MCA6596247.1 acyl-CoA/acyl-ACP dehydrogenase [Pseudanabaena sp. M046S1SP1A06QC]MCA6600768.1 acyl-CoA/acyl-ACP de